MERERLQALAAQLGEPPGQVAATLDHELDRAFAQIDAGLSRGDADAVTRATHAARNSVLMLADEPVLDGLRTLDAAVRRRDETAARSARAELGVSWARLAAELRAAG